MTTAVDTCVLLAYLLAEDEAAEGAETVLRAAYSQGALIVGEVAYAELMPQFGHRTELDEVLERLGISFVGSSAAMAATAGRARAEYRRRGGKRERLIADFLAGAHALVNAHRLLTRDSRFYSQDFAGLVVLEP